MEPRDIRGNPYCAPRRRADYATKTVAASAPGHANYASLRTPSQKCSLKAIRKTTGEQEEAVASESDDPAREISRRDLFRTVGTSAAAAVAGMPLPAGDAVAQRPPSPSPQAGDDRAAVRLEALETLTAAEADILEAICARLIPSDEHGPGAAEARAAHYIDRALTGPLHTSRDAYAVGLAAIDAYAQQTIGASFVQLSPRDQDSVLTDVENNVATGFMPNAATFFNLVRTHTIQGTFCDPYYGGNANFVGWDLIGYPGLRITVDLDEQRMSAPKAVRKSAYEEAMFTPKGSQGGGDHGHRP
jgi:gluconate 2-dehydrogenase gamma chain